MVNIEKRIVPLSNRRAIYSGINQKRTLTVHQTGNTAKGANADMHAWLQHRGYARASWHIQSDDHRIIQSFPFSAQTWHAGDGRGNGNLHSISWEICINRDGDYLKSLQVAAEGIAQVLKDERLTVNDLRQHHDWSRKNCPAQIRAGKDGVNWNKFKQMVQKAYDGGTVSKPVKPSVSARPDANLSFDQVVDKTIAGEYGSQPHRENNIRTRTNFSYEEIQEGVNRKLRGTPSKPSKVNFDTIVNNVIDGTYGNGQARFDKIKSLDHDPAKVQAEVNKRLLGKVPSKPKPKPAPVKPKWTTEKVAQEIAKGIGGWGNGQTRINHIKKAGLNPTTVQNRVNEILGHKSKPKKSAAQVADEIYRGRGNWGTGNTRKNRLRNAGYNPDEVQRLVNQKFR